MHDTCKVLGRPWESWQKETRSGVVQLSEAVERICSDTAHVMDEARSLEDIERLEYSITHLRLQWWGPQAGYTTALQHVHTITLLCSNGVWLAVKL